MRLSSLLLLALLCVDTGVRAEGRFSSRPPGRREALLPLRLDGHVGVRWDGAPALGVRADLPLVVGTFRYSPRDELAVSLGADLSVSQLGDENTLDFYPTAALQWSLGVNERLAFVPELGLIGHFDADGWRRPLANLGFGARYYLRRSFGLQARFGWPIAFTAGVVF